jgi:hypothetical protein
MVRIEGNIIRYVVYYYVLPWYYYRVTWSIIFKNRRAVSKYVNDCTKTERRTALSTKKRIYPRLEQSMQRRGERGREGERGGQGGRRGGEGLDLLD